MQVNSRAMFLTIGIFWGACVFFVGILNMISLTYGRAFLELCASIYPGYHPGTGFVSVLIRALYALVDGAIGGAILGWLYNQFAENL